MLHLAWPNPVLLLVSIMSRVLRQSARAVALEADVGREDGEAAGVEGHIEDGDCVNVIADEIGHRRVR